MPTCVWMCDQSYWLLGCYLYWMKSYNICISTFAFHVRKSSQIIFYLQLTEKTDQESYYVRPIILLIAYHKYYV